MKGAEMVKAYEKAGWQVDRIKGSHYVMKKDGETESIPVHTKDLPKGLCEKLKKRAGLK